MGSDSPLLSSPKKQQYFEFDLYLFTQKGVVTRVYDGDTLTFMPDDKKKDQLKIRLAEIDAPESDQPGGKESAEYLKVINKP